MRERIAGALVAAALAGSLAAGSAVAFAIAAPATPPAVSQVAITADAMSIDAATRVATASGRVRITDGKTTATAARATLFQKEGRGVLVGEARVTGPQGVLEGEEIRVEYTTAAITKITASGNASLDVEGGLVSARIVTIVPSTDTVTAQRDVTFFSKPDIIAKGAELVYQRAKGIAMLQGQARLQNRDGVIEGDRLEGFKQWERLVATGGVHGVYRDIDVRSRAAEVLGAEKRAVFTGEVQLTQPGRRLTTEKVTVWYEAGRVVAEGQTWIRIEPTP